MEKKVRISKRIILMMFIISALLIVLFKGAFSILFVVGVVWGVYGWIVLKDLSKGNSNKLIKVISRLYTLGLSAFLIVFFSVEGIAILYMSQLRSSEQISKLNYAIVLGAGLDGDKVSARLKGRLDEALNYHKINEEVIIIVSGGQGKDELISEAEAMKYYLVSNGVSNKQVIEEDQATSTIENIKFSKEILKNIGALDEEVLIITSDYHSFRAHMIANKLEIKNESLAFKTPLVVKPNYMVREYITLVKDFIVLNFRNEE
jgi:uncharacterized SAM-binding protein YcdF (DUF218 family)